MTTENYSNEAQIAQLIESKAKVNIYLVNGIKLTGIISANDGETILLQGQTTGKGQVVYKHALSTIQPV